MHIFRLGEQKPKVRGAFIQCDKTGILREI